MNHRRIIVLTAVSGTLFMAAAGYAAASGSGEHRPQRPATTVADDPATHDAGDDHGGNGNEAGDDHGRNRGADSTTDDPATH
ncbi:MAG: hypothetical protein KDB12_02740, partial [Ilumatobacter sp.]|nr:hypothetical protein [Ilumatobacter sp.]